MVAINGFDNVSHRRIGGLASLLSVVEHGGAILESNWATRGFLSVDNFIDYTKYHGYDNDLFIRFRDTTTVHQLIERDGIYYAVDDNANYHESIGHFLYDNELFFVSDLYDIKIEDQKQAVYTGAINEMDADTLGGHLVYNSEQVNVVTNLYCENNEYLIDNIEKFISSESGTLLSTPSPNTLFTTQLPSIRVRVEETDCIGSLTANQVAIVLCEILGHDYHADGSDIVYTPDENDCLCFFLDLQKVTNYLKKVGRQN